MPDAISSTGPYSPIGQTAAASAGAGQPITTDTPTIDPELLQRPETFDKDMFLQLLVAQLKYQNPLDPMDSSQFMAQTAQFTTVEKLEELTSQLGESLANDRLGTATGLIGREVTYARPDGQTTTALVQSVRFDPMGPRLILADSFEIGMGEVHQVSART